VALFGILPEALPRFVTYLLYRWEVIIRTTVVVGFVSAGGLGTSFRLAMSYFKYTEVALILIWYLIIVLAVDFAAAFLRRLAD
jgi:phosphonate transport system permease protein